MKNHLIKQTWSKVCFINLEVDHDELRKLVPKELTLDSYHNKFYVSIVPFRMSEIKLKSLPTLPYFCLNELNLRTYVLYRNKPGIYFFTLDSNQRFANTIARLFFKLPYHYADVKLKTVGSHYNVDADDHFELKSSITNERVTTPFSKWICERYSLFGQSKKGIFRGDVFHEPWTLFKSDVLSLSNRFTNKYGFSEAKIEGPVLYAEKIKVAFNKFVIA